MAIRIATGRLPNTAKRTSPPVRALTWMFHPTGDAATERTANGSPKWTITLRTSAWTSVAFIAPDLQNPAFCGLQRCSPSLSSGSPVAVRVDSQTEGLGVELPLMVQLEAGRYFADVRHSRRAHPLGALVARTQH